MVNITNPSTTRLFLVDGPGGTGKTFLGFNCVRRTGDIALAIAFLLLNGSRTFHSKYKISLDVNNTSMCDIRPRSELAFLIR